MARTHTNKIEIISVLIIKTNLRNEIIVPVNKTAVNSLITKIFAYSAIKIRANIPLLYSTLNPDTSSLSPSAKSNGVRFVSAKLVINQITITGIYRIIIGRYEYEVMIDKSRVMLITNLNIKISDMLTS